MVYETVQIKPYSHNSHHALQQESCTIYNLYFRAQKLTHPSRNKHVIQQTIDEILKRKNYPHSLLKESYKIVKNKIQNPIT